MKLIERIKNYFWRDLGSCIEEIIPKEKEEKCKHDWEIVEYGDFWTLTDTGIGTYIIYTNLKPKWSRCWTDRQATNSVCLKCGKCENGIEKIKNKYKEQEQNKINSCQERIKRKEYAKQLWENGCKK